MVEKWNLKYNYTFYCQKFVIELKENVMKKFMKFLLFPLIIIILLITLLITNIFAWKEISIKLAPTYNELFSEQQLQEKGHKSIISEYSTDVSACYENEDGTKSLYIYASPIRYLNSSGQLSLIDTRIANVRDNEMRDKGYIYTIANSDIKPFYPKQLTGQQGVLVGKDISYQIGIYCDKPVLGWYKNQDNFISEAKNMIVYKNAMNNSLDISFYPTSLGTNCEIELNDSLKDNAFSLWLRINEQDVTTKKEPGGYLTLNKVDKTSNTVGEILGVIQKPLLKDKRGNISERNSIELFPEGDGYCRLQFQLDDAYLKKGAKAFIAFEIRREKQPDNAIYSNLPDLQYAYLKNYSVIGNSRDYGTGRLLIRYKFAKFFNLQSSQIKEANYYAYSLTKSNDELELLSVLEDWCSLTGNWNNHYKTGEQTSVLELKEQKLKFNITEEVKKWCDDPDGQMEHNGVMLKSLEEREGESNVILSNDNTLISERNGGDTEMTYL